MANSLAHSQNLIRCLSLMRLSPQALILDAPSGSGRNAFELARLGYEVTAVDNDLRSLQKLENSKSNNCSSVRSVIADLSSNQLPFGSCSFAAIVCIHFSVQTAIKEFDRVLKRGGALYVETFGGHGHNYLQLPRAGEIREALTGYEFQIYTEKHVGPPNQRAVTLRLVAHKYW